MPELKKMNDESGFQIQIFLILDQNYNDKGFEKDLYLVTLTQHNST